MSRAEQSSEQTSRAEQLAEQRAAAESREQRAESREQRAERREESKSKSFMESAHHNEAFDAGLLAIIKVWNQSANEDSKAAWHTHHGLVTRRLGIWMQNNW